MRRVIGLVTVDGELHWQYTGNPEAYRSEPEGIVISFGSIFGGDSNQSKPYLLQVMEKNGENWLWKQGDTWFLDLARVREKFTKLSDLSWLEGVAKFHQKSTATHRDPNPFVFTVYREGYLLEKNQKIFLSHKGADKPLVREFFRVFKTLGFDPWLDEDAMPAGTPLERGILKGFDESCAAVFFITPNYVDAGYLATEVEYGVQQKRHKGDRFRTIVIRFNENGKKGLVPALLQNDVWKDVDSPLVALDEILRALPITVGPVRWKDARPEEPSPPKAEVAAPIVFNTHDVKFQFMGRDAAGGQIPSKKADATWVSYGFKLDAFNPRPVNVGLMDILLHYVKDGKLIHSHVPGKHTGETRGRAPFIPKVTSLTLPSQEWFSLTFRGGLHDEQFTAAADCQEVYLTAKSIEGEEFRVPLAYCIQEKA